MYFEDYIFFMIAIFTCMIFSFIANSKVNGNFNKYNSSRCRSGLTGSETVSRLLRHNEIYDISIGQVKGTLTDHYHPTNAIVNLSESTYNNNSISAVAVAAHEVGHVMQKKEGYGPYKLRTMLVPVVNFGSYLAMPLVFIGLILDYFALTADADLGFTLAMIGVILYGGSLLFALVTLPVELDASARAKKMLLEEGILSEDEIPAAKKVLSAAALTYVASLLTSLVYFLRFLFQVLALFGRRNNRR